MGFSRQEDWSGWPLPSLGDLPNPGIEPRSPALQVDSLPPAPPEQPRTAFTLLLSFHPSHTSDLSQSGLQAPGQELQAGAGLSMCTPGALRSSVEACDRDWSAPASPCPAQDSESAGVFSQELNCAHPPPKVMLKPQDLVSRNVNIFIDKP